MHLLILAILSSFAISALIKTFEAQGMDTRVMTASNYIVAAAIGWALVLVSGGVPPLTPPTLFLGLGGGVLWPVGLYILMYGIGSYGISLAGSVRRLSLAVPVTFGLLVLHEDLTWPIAIGIVLTVTSFFLLRPPQSDDLRRLDQQALWFFPVMVVYFGMTDVWVNLFNTYGAADERFVFLTLIFTFSLVFAWGLVLLQRIEVDRESFLKGLTIGVPNILATFFLLEALKHPFFDDLSTVAYTLYAVIGVTLTFTTGIFIWREEVNRLSVFGILIAIGAIVLLNL